VDAGRLRRLADAGDGILCRRAKVAAMAVFVRVMHDGFGGAVGQWQQVIVFISIASMVLGAFAAIGQENIKRLLAYSSIGHMGYALVGLAAGTQSGVRGIAIYMAIYLVMTLGAFACVIYMRRRGTAVERISRPVRPCPQRPDDGVRAGHADVLVWPAFRRSRASSASTSCSSLPSRRRCSPWR
jgi:hypothetical protein